VLAGWIYDRTSSYSQALLPVMGAYLLSMLLYWTLRRPSRRPARQVGPA
jgi:hypothetical protein